MSDFSIQEMLAMQRTLQEKYKDKWEAIRPEAGKHKLLWMVGEIGEVVDIVKKNGDVEPLENKDLRKHLVEEMADVLICIQQLQIMYHVTDEELHAMKQYKEKRSIEREGL